MKKSVLIIGSGIGGLATALRLAKRGFDVKVLEKNSQAGGRLNQLKKAGFTFDTGPSFFSMSYEFEELAKDCDITLPFKYYPLDPLYTVSFSHSEKVYHLYRDIRKLAEQFKDIEPDFEQKMNRYLDKGGQLFHDTVDLVIKQNVDTLPEYIKTLMQVNPVHLPVLTRNFWQQVSRYFDSEIAREIVSLVAFFLGRTPFDTSAIYTLLSYTEFRHDGYFNVEGGMYKIVEGLVDELKKAGGEIIYNTEIISYKEQNGKISAFVDKESRDWIADYYVANADAAVFRGKVLGRKKYSVARLDKKEWTMGPLTIYLGINKKLPHIEHHNYYLGDNFKEYANKVFQNPGTIQKPYYYVNVLSKSNPDCAPEGCESLFFVCPVPDLRFKPDWSDRDAIVDSIIDDFSKRIGTDIVSSIVTKTIYTPIDWQDQFNLHRGSGLGLSHSMMQIGALRPKNFDEEYRNLFYVGASTVPGTGLPMGIISSKLAVERILRQE